MANISEKKLEMKVVILGCSCSGKTSIIRRYIENTFDDNSPATHGASYSQKKINIKDKSINLHIWDTPGASNFLRLNIPFMIDADAIILVYNLAWKSDLENLKDYWNTIIKKNSSKESSKKNLFKINIVKILVGAQEDRYIDEEIYEDEGKEFAKKINVLFKLVSSSNGTGINDLFETIVIEYLKKLEEIEGNKILSILKEYFNY